MVFDCVQGTVKNVGKEVVPVFKYYPNMDLEGLNKGMKYFSVYSLNVLRIQS
jgi:hypothetical protein